MIRKIIALYVIFLFFIFQFSQFSADYSITQIIINSIIGIGLGQSFGMLFNIFVSYLDFLAIKEKNGEMPLISIKRENKKNLWEDSKNRKLIIIQIFFVCLWILLYFIFNKSSFAISEIVSNSIIFSAITIKWFYFNNNLFTIIFDIVELYFFVGKIGLLQSVASLWAVYALHKIIDSIFSLKASFTVKTKFGILKYLILICSMVIIFFHCYTKNLINSQILIHGIIFYGISLILVAYIVQAHKNDK